MAFFSRPPSWESRGRGDSQGAHLRPSLWGGLLNGSLNGETNPDPFVGSADPRCRERSPIFPADGFGRASVCDPPSLSVMVPKDEPGSQDNGLRVS